MFNLLFSMPVLANAKTLASALLFGAITTLSDPGTVVKPTSFNASVYVGANNKIKLAVEKNIPGTVSVTLSDKYKQVLYQTMLGKRNMKSALQFDVSQLPDGQYTLELKSDEGSIVKQINLETPQSSRTIEMQ